ncbi:hypothetical protein HDU92_001255 [Lobulomyces angularis]|nr:hypothetical protein HDU92_001255 [Lobulomyces angularis]
MSKNNHASLKNSIESELHLANLFKVTVPPKNPRTDQPKRKVIFVDPDDPDVAYWWPALIIPIHEIPLFRKFHDLEKVFLPEDGEYLVCYFEDGSFSVVGEADVIPFNPTLPPYTSYVSGPDSNRFCNDKAVILATAYYEKEIVPNSFLWLKSENEKALEELKLKEIDIINDVTQMEIDINENSDELSIQHEEEKLSEENLLSKRRNSKSIEFITVDDNIPEEGTGIYGYQKKRVSHPVKPLSPAAWESKKSLEKKKLEKEKLSSHVSHAKKIKVERKGNSNRKDIKLKNPSISSQAETFFNKKITKHNTSAIGKSKTKGYVSEEELLSCDNCDPNILQKKTIFLNTTIYIRKLCENCNNLFSEFSKKNNFHDYEQLNNIKKNEKLFVNNVANRGTNFGKDTNLGKLLQRLDSVSNVATKNGIINQKIGKDGVVVECIEPFTGYFP